MTSSASPRRSLETRKGSYVDSVTLMQVSKRVGSLPGVRSALVAMATDLNLDLAVQMGFEPPAGVSPNEMLVALEADGDDALSDARAEVDRALDEAASPAPSTFGAAPPPATVAAADDPDTRGDLWRAQPWIALLPRALVSLRLPMSSDSASHSLRTALSASAW